MSFTFRRGPVLARALRTCASRSFQPARISSNLAVNTPKPLLSLSLSSIARARFIHSSTIQRQANAGVATAPAAQNSESFPAVSEFADLSHHGYVHPRIIHSITDRMNIKTMTDVQKLTIAHSVGGSDVLAQAKTGTGKTLAFLVPVLQKILTVNPSLVQRSQGPVSRSSARDIRALIISPTRELAEQIAVEARKVASGTGVVVQVAVGGTRKMEALNRVRREGCHILVGTPGRLKDILSDYSSGVSAPNLDVLVLDEADRLLDDGFGPEIESIQELLPDPTGRDRQTLMFSATIPREVMRMVKRTMKPGFQTIKTVSGDEVPTHMRVPQKMVSLRGFENAYPAIIEILKKYIDRTAADPNLRPMKALVYFNTTTEVEMAHEAFLGLREDPSQPRSANPLGRRILHIHSKLSQSQRTNYSEAFRRASSAILLSSDVTARGLDFPDVTHVIQVGTPRTRESYIHRLGRTGRAGKEGEGWALILGGQKGEKRSFIEKVGDLPIEDDRSIQAATVDMSQPESILGPVAETIKQATAALKLVPAVTKEDTYRILLSSTIPLMDRKQDVVDALNNLSRHGWGLEPPAVSPTFAEKLGLSRVPTLNIQERRAPRGLMGDILNAASRSGDAGGFRRSRDGFASRRDDTSGGYRSEGFRRRDDMSGGYRYEGPPRRQYDDRSRSSRSRYSFEQSF